MHLKNLHNTQYNFESLILSHSPLEQFTITNTLGDKTIDFSNPQAVLALNTAILKSDYGLLNWSIPEGYLCPPIPGRADYLHHIADLLAEDEITKDISGLDIGMGANCIYPILGARINDWHMTGSDIDPDAIASAEGIIASNTKLLSKLIEVRLQPNNAHLFSGIIKPKEYYHFTMCNPPFYTSKESAETETRRKQRNLAYSAHAKRNFGGQANELWCNGGEALFIKRMIKESVEFKEQVGLFTCLVSRSAHLPKIMKQLTKLKATYNIVRMEQGNKKSRIVAWRF